MMNNSAERSNALYIPLIFRFAHFFCAGRLDKKRYNVREVICRIHIM